MRLEIGSGSGHEDVKITLALEGFRTGVPKIEPPKTGSPIEVTKTTRPRLGLTPPGEVQKPNESDRPTLVDKRGKRKPLSAEEADPSGTEFMGIKTKARSIVFILDFSGSMHQEKMDHLLSELKISVNRLTVGSSFFIMFFDTEALLMPGWPASVSPSVLRTASCRALSLSTVTGSAVSERRTWMAVVIIS